MALKFEYTVYIGCPAAEVWHALTTKSLIDRYYMAPVYALYLKVGGRISYGTNSEAISGEITELVPEERLVHTFKFANSTDPGSTVTYELKPVGDRMCMLTITHSGFETESQPFRDISGGWPMIVSSLKSLLETGEDLPWPSRSS